MTCVSCSAGNYLNYRNETHFSCKKCPENSTTFDNTNAADVYDCFCAAGFHAPANSNKCVQCDAGYYKDFAGNQSCLQCPPNSFSIATGGSDISACLCQRGFYAIGDTCVQCVEGSYKAAISNTSCEACPAHHYCPTGSISPIPCFNHSQSFPSSIDNLDCMCNAGYHTQYTWASSLFDESCGPRPYLCDDIAAEEGQCPTGFCLKEDGTSCTVDYVTGHTTTASTDGVCRTDLVLQCDYNPIELQFYSTSEMQPLFRAHPDIHTAAYWTDVNNVVSQSNKRGRQCINECAANPLCDYAVVQDYGQSHYWTTYATDCWHVFCNGDVLNCISPRRNGHWITYAKVADLCVQVDVTEEKCNSTLCAVADKSCARCAPGTYNNQIDNTACFDCPQNTYNDKYGAQSLHNCSQCDNNAASPLQSVSVDSCACNLGYSGDPGTPCTACAAGTFRNALESYICEDCPANTFNELLGANSSAACIACPGNTSSQARSHAIESCVCNAGYYAASAVYDCHACLPGNYQSSTNSTSCTPCAAGKYGTTTAANSADFCVQCARGFYSDKQGVTACEQCDVDTWQSSAAARDTACEPCVANSTTHGQKGSTSLYNCICDPGFAPRLNATPEYHCVPCPAGKYCPGNNTEAACPANSFSLLGQSECTVCSDNSYTSDGGNTDPSQCICKQGYAGTFHDNCTACTPGFFQPLDFRNSSHGALDIFACQECAAGTYQTLSAASACLHCPESTSSTQQSKQKSDCACNAGYFGLTDSCELCAPGTYCPGGEFAQTCRPFSSSAAGAISETDCKCLPGSFSQTDGGTCLLCEPSKYCTGDKNVSTCPPHSTSAPGSFAVQQCTCENGNWRGCIAHDGNLVDVNGNTCVIDYTTACFPCPPNTVCSNETVTHCPEHSQSDAGSGHADECICLNGYYLHNAHSEEEHVHATDDGHIEPVLLDDHNYTEHHTIHGDHDDA